MSPVRPDDDEAPYQRRIGQRHPMAVPLEWSPVTTRKWRRPKPVPAITDNLSLSGAGFEAETSPDIQKGSVMMVKLGDVTDTAAVRMVKPLGKGDRCYYGVEFHGPEMLAYIRDLITEYTRPVEPTE